MVWIIEFEDEFETEFDELNPTVQDALLAKAKVLEQFGPSLGRPHVDTLNDSEHTNMKELRFDADGGVWRVAFAFDKQRKAILLCGGDKQGDKRFYKNLLRVADRRFAKHLEKGEKDG